MIRCVQSVAAALLTAVLSVGVFTSSVSAQQQPTADFDSILNTFFGAENGTIAFADQVFAFVAEGPFNGEVAVLDPAGKVVQRFAYFDDPMRDGVFLQARAKGPADVKLTEPGIYTIVYLVDGKPVTRMPVMLRKKASDDPFNPDATYTFDGYWRTHAYFTLGLYDEKPFPELNFWVGGVDLPEGSRKDRLFIQLLRDGKVVAHTKHAMGHIPEGRFMRQRLSLFHPHEYKNAANAQLFMMSDLLVDGSYELRMTRNSDEKMIRSYDFEVAEKKLVPLKLTDLKYEPHVDHILPRVQTRNVNVWGMEEAIWIRDGGNGKASAAE